MEIALLCVFAFLMFALPSSREQNHPSKPLLSSRILHSLLGCLMVFSPLYTFLLIDLLGWDFDIARNLIFVVLAAALALPLTVLIATLTGPPRLAAFVSFVEVESKTPISKLWRLWIATFGVLFLLSLALRLIA